MLLRRGPRQRDALPPSKGLPLLLCLFGLLAPSSVLAARHALLIGVSDYSASGLHDLPGTQNDLALMEQVLRDQLGFGTDSDPPPRVLRNAQATHSGIKQAFLDLAQQVQPGDFVYIHYSGHGSYTQDLNGDEIRSGQDQTWVGYGARSAKVEGIDRYDILDDELNEWVGNIAERTPHVVMVSDSCHSATVTRGEVQDLARAGPPDAKGGEHPLGRNPFHRYTLESVVRVGAARDDQTAHEFEDKENEENKRYGILTYNWARSIQMAAPDETWDDLFIRTASWVSRTQGQAQNPQIAGTQKSASAFGGKIPPRGAKVLVKEVDQERRIATLAVGRLVGATEGSLYAPLDESSPVTVKLTEVSDTLSRGEVQGGEVAKGAFLREKVHAYPSKPLKVFVAADPQTAQEGWLGRLRGLFPGTAASDAKPEGTIDRLLGYVLVDSQREADLVVRLLQPKRSASGDYHYRQSAGGRDTLPEHDPQAAPEVWVLTQREVLLHERMRVSLANPEAGLKVLRNNLRLYRRLRELEGVAEDNNNPSRVMARVVLFERCAEGDTRGCQQLPSNKVFYRRGETVLFADLDKRQWAVDDLISFELKNRMLSNSHAYLLDIGPDGCIETIFPPGETVADAARLSGYATLDLSSADVDVLFRFDKPGLGSVLLLATEAPIDPGLLEQECYDKVRKGVPLSELEKLLVAISNGRTRSGDSFKTGSWSAQLGKYKVAEGNARPEGRK